MALKRLNTTSKGPWPEAMQTQTTTCYSARCFMALKHLNTTGKGPWPEAMQTQTTTCYGARCSSD